VFHKEIEVEKSEFFVKTPIKIQKSAVDTLLNSCHPHFLEEAPREE